MTAHARYTALLAAVALAGCGGDGDGSATAPSVGRVLGALIGAADKASAPWRCAAADVPTGPDETLRSGEHTWKLASHALRREGDAARTITIGVVADATGAAPQTIAALGRLRAALEAEHPDLVLSLGGMGSTSDELQATLGTLSDRAAWPLVALPGDLEPTLVHGAAIAALRKRGDVVVDGRGVRWIELPGVTIATVPGAGAVERLAAGVDGCGWDVADITRIATELTARPGLRIVAAPEAPRAIVAGNPAGELALAPSKALPFDVVLHGPLDATPTAPRSGSRDGAGASLTPGTADATPRLPRAHHPSAGLLVIRGTTWSWRSVVDASADDK